MELKQEIKSSLKQVIEKEKGKTYHTGELRIIDLAKDCLEAIDELEKDATAYRELMTPFKPTDIEQSFDYDSDGEQNESTVGYCKCGAFVTEFSNSEHCHACAQKLDWESEGEL